MYFGTVICSMNVPGKFFFFLRGYGRFFFRISLSVFESFLERFFSEFMIDFFSVLETFHDRFWNVIFARLWSTVSLSHF